MRTVEVRQCRAAGACESVYTIAYDAKGQVAEIEDRAGRKAQFAYDGLGNLARARDPLDVARGWPGVRYEYAWKRLVALRTSEEERVEFTITGVHGTVRAVRHVGNPDRVHLFTQERIPLGQPRTEANRVVHHRSPDGHHTTYLFDGYQRSRAVTLPSGDRIVRDWDGFELARVVAPDGTATRWTTVSEQEIERLEPSGNTVRIRFKMTGGENRANPFARPIERIEDDLGLVESRGYADGRLIWIENGAGERSLIAYDAENQVASITEPGGRTIAFADYGAHGQPEMVTLAGQTETRVYDAVGNRVSASGFDTLDLRSGGEIARHYDADRNLAEIVLADAPFNESATQQSIHIEYRSDGQPLRITRPHGGDHEFSYDAQGSLVERRERVDGTWHSTRFEVDAVGRRTAEILPNGMHRESVYDEDGNLAARRAWRDGSLESEAIYDWADGRLVSIDDAAYGAAETFHYDGSGNLASVAFPDGERLDFTYDLRGRLTDEHYVLPGGTVLRHLGTAYDGADRATTLADGAGTLLDRSYVDGRLDQVAYGNGLIRNFDYDAGTGLLEATTLQHPTHGLVEVTAVTRAIANLPGSIELVATTTTTGPAAATTREEPLLGPADTGDEGNRLLGWSDGQTPRDFAYDALSNLTESENGALVHVYNAERNRLLRIEDAQTGDTVVDYAYDAAGYLTSRAGTGIAWTAQGHAAARGADAFAWDATGRPTRRIVGGVERHFRFGGRVETDAAGTPVRMDLQAVVLELATGATRYRHTDYRGNVKLVSDDAGDIVAHYAYAAYGVESLVGSDDEAAGFAGGRGGGGRVLLGSRLHDPLAARFLAPDPIFQLHSQFTYTQGNPVDWWDPSGLEAGPSPNQRMGNAAVRMGIAYSATLVGMMMVYPPTLFTPLGSVLIVMGVEYFSEALGDYLEAREDAAEARKSRKGSSTSSLEFGGYVDLNCIGDWAAGPLIDFSGCPGCGPGPGPKLAAIGAGGPGGFGSGFASGFGGGFGGGGF